MAPVSRKPLFFIETNKRLQPVTRSRSTTEKGNIAVLIAPVLIGKTWHSGAFNKIRYEYNSKYLAKYATSQAA